MSNIGKWHWNDVNHEWEKGQLGIETVRLLGAGLARAGSCRCYFIHVSPSAANALCEITDAVAAGGVVKFDHWDTDRESSHMLFVPPMQFNAGIFLETATNLTSVVFGVLSD